MKKILFSLMAAIMIFATSCENDLELGATGKTSVVSFSVESPEMASRAYSDGLSATKLQYAVYEGEQILPALTKTDGTINGKTTVNLQLTTGNTYTVIFWAAAPDAPYSVNFANKTMTVDYTNAVSNAENRDAFYAKKTFTVTGSQTETIELRRPFAQLNIGTADYVDAKKAGYEPKYSGVKVKNVYTTLNLWDGGVDGATEVMFDYAAIPAGEDFPVSGYDYMSMNYLLVASTKALVDIEFGYTETDASAAMTRIVGSVPVQRNYRTNIFGQLLTSDVAVNVVIDPIYEEPAHEANLQYAATYGGIVKLTQDVVLDNTINVLAGKAMEIDLNGYKISGTDKGTASFGLFNNKGTLTIKDSSTGKTGAITLNATENRGWNAYSSVISNNPGGKVIVEGGKIEHLGGTDMAYGIDNLTNGRGTYAETIINGGTVKSPYRAIRQFLNGVEAENILTVNGGTIEGDNKSIWMQDPSQNANSGKLTVEGGELKGDVYLTVTAGSTEWPVEVSIKEESVKNQVLTSNVPAGYHLVLSNGYYTIVNANVVVTTADELAAALNSDNEVIFLGADITGDIVITQTEGKDITLLSNGKKFTGVMTVFGNGNQNGAETLTIKGINFVAKNGANACIVSPDRTVNNKYSYAHNVTVENCTFADEDGTVNCAAIRHEDGGDKNWTVKGCTVLSGMHSIMQVNNVEGSLVIEDCKVYSKNGANLNSTTKVAMNECEFDVTGYAVRFGVSSGGNLGTPKNYAISNSTLKSANDEGDAVIIFRASAVDATLTLTNTTLVGTPQISGATSATTIVRN